MRIRVLRSTILLTLSAAISSSVTIILVQQQGSAKESFAGQAKQKNLRDITKERDWKIEDSNVCHREYGTLGSMTAGAHAIVYGRISDSKSFWDVSGHPIEHGENITTEHTVDVHRVLKDETRNLTPESGKPVPAPITTPLIIAHNGGVIYENGHRASVKVKEYEPLASGKECVLFLHWSSDYKAYILAGGASGVVMVNDDRSLKPLTKSEEIQEKLRGVDLESLISQLTQ